jgi:hypothetical protein
MSSAISVVLFSVTASLTNLIYLGDKVTIRNLANHTSVLPKFVPVPPKDSSLVNYWIHSGAISEQRFLDSLTLFKPGLRPGTRFIQRCCSIEQPCTVHMQVQPVFFGDSG